MMISEVVRLERKNAFDANLVFGVREFNIATGRDVHLANRERRVSRMASFIDPDTGLIDASMTRERDCPLCNGTTGRRVFVKDGFPHVRCDACGMVYVTPTLREEQLHTLYRDEDSFTRVLMNTVQQGIDRTRFEYALELIETIMTGRGDMLDIGCGPGTFLEVARKRGWRVSGIEWNAWCVRHLRERKIPVYDRPLAEASIEPRSLDCVTAWSVVEHVLEPGRLFEDVRRVLRPGGSFVVMVPNIDSLVVRVLHEKAATFCGEMHVNFFSPKTLSRLLDAMGFEVQHMETFITELGTIQNWLALEDPYLGDAAPVLEMLTPQVLHDRMLGSQLFAIARAR